MQEKLEKVLKFLEYIWQNQLQCCVVAALASTSQTLPFSLQTCYQMLLR